jgi:anti-anti-sigma regulatory factor
MVLKIELVESESDTVLRLIGRMTSSDGQQLKARIAEAANGVTLDLEQVCLIDLDAVRFLAAADRRGIALRHVPRYVREWILLEKPRIRGIE